MGDQAVEDVADLLAPILAQFGQEIPSLGKFKVVPVMPKHDHDAL